MQVCHFQHLLRQLDKNEPGRFLGEGVSFRAKLIGVLEVPEARGDRMCQEALADLKMAIRAAGEHKQRIQVHVAIDGLRLRDDKTGDSLYHHPVHKISFIAQDMTDSRAFGYIFGSPDTGHRFFGIKTDKAASQVVIAMRDLFQVVFELKKKEVEMAKQQLEAGKAVAIALTRHTMPQSIALADKMKNLIISTESASAASKSSEAGAEGGVAELVDLEQELCSLRRGLTQVEGLTPSADPFGDSFIGPSSHTQKGLLPPPPSGSSTRGRNTPAASRTLFSPSKQPATLPFDLAPPSSEYEATPTSLVDNINVPSEPAELKNPPKKVLKELAQSLITESEKEHYGPATTMTSLTRHSGGSVAIAKPQPGGVFGASFFSSDPFAETDPFDNTDPFSDSFKDDPFTSMQEFPKSNVIRAEDLRKDVGVSVGKVRELDKEPVENGRNVFNGPLQVSLPPEPAPKSPRLQRQIYKSSSARQSADGGGAPRRGRGGENGSPPPPLPPKKCVDISIARPPPRPPLDHEPEGDPAPALPRPARKKEPMADRSTKPRLSSVATNSSEDEYLTPAPPPLPAARRFDITLTQLLTCSMDELAVRLRVPAATLSSMTLPQLTEYLRSYLAADNERAHIHIEPSSHIDKSKHISAMSSVQHASASPLSVRPKPSAPPLSSLSISSEFKPQFEDNFTPPLESSDTFVANFDNFDQKANSSYDRYAAFREIQEQELKALSILDPLDEPKQDSDGKEELTAIDNIIRANLDLEIEDDTSKSPLKSLDELTIDSFNMFRSSVSPKPSHTPIDAKIEDIKSVMKNLQIEKCRRSVSPRDNGHVEVKLENTNDRYAALREITITEPPDEFESLPPEPPKERKKSDEKSDGFDNSDFFDCIDNSSLSFTHVEDAFRKSPVVKERDDKAGDRKEVKVELTPVRELHPPPARLSTGSISDVVSGSSPDTKGKNVVGGSVVGAGGRWAVLGGAGGSGASSDSRESEPRAPARARRARNASPGRRHHCTEHNIQTSSSSRDVSPWDEDLPPVSRLPRPPSHHRDRHRESRHNSSGSRECLDSESGREKDKIRDKRDMRDRDLSRDSRESARDCRDSGSGRDRRDSKERDLRLVSRDKRDMRDRDLSLDSRESARDGRDSGSGRDRRDSKERDLRLVSRDKRDMRDRDLSLDSRESARDGRDSGSGRDRRDSKDRDHRDHRRDRRSRERETDTWDRERTYSRDYRDSRSRERPKDYREKDRDRHRKPRHSYDEEEDYSDGCGSGRSSSRDRWPDQRWRRDERNYGSLGWRESRWRAETRQRETTEDPRYSSTLGWAPRRSVRAERAERDARRRPRRDEPRRRDHRFSNDFSPRDQPSPFDEPVASRRGYPAYTECPRFTMYGAGPPAGPAVSGASQMVHSRFAFEADEALPPTASPLSGSSLRARDGESPATRFRFDSDSISPRSMFEDDFTALPPRGRTASIAEEEESEVPPLRAKPPQHRDIKKSESINIFTRESDPFEGDAFFACTGSDRAARRENWPGDFQGFDNA